MARNGLLGFFREGKRRIGMKSSCLNEPTILRVYLKNSAQMNELASDL